MSYSAEALLQMVGFNDGLALAARELLEAHLEIPREVHFVGDLRRLMLSQVTMGLHFEHLRDPASSPISPNNLAGRFHTSGIASRNTIHAFLMQMRKYRFVVPLETADRRQRAVQATEMSEQLIRRYFDIHLRALDAIDNGGRHALSLRYPKLLNFAQPRFAQLLLEQAGWYKPPQSIIKFVNTDSGISVLHDLVPSLPADQTSPVWVGKVSAVAMSTRYKLSRTHTARLFGSAREAKLIGWKNESNRGDCWVSPTLVRDYRNWQAIKLAAVSEAFRYACYSADW